MLPINCSICNGTICYESQYGRTTFELPCGCKFGTVCIDTWILVNGKCPVCYMKVDHELVFQPQEELLSYSDKLVYENARHNALEKNGVCREVAGYTVAGKWHDSDFVTHARSMGIYPYTFTFVFLDIASELASDALKSVANSVAKIIISGADEEVQHGSLQVDKITQTNGTGERNNLIQNAKVVTGVAATATGYVGMFYDKGNVIFCS